MVGHMHCGYCIWSLLDAGAVSRRGWAKASQVSICSEATWRCVMPSESRSWGRGPHSPDVTPVEFSRGVVMPCGAPAYPYEVPGPQSSTCYTALAFEGSGQPQQVGCSLKR